MSNLNHLQKFAVAFRKGSRIGMRDMRVGLGKAFPPEPMLEVEKMAIIDSLPCSKEEAEHENRDAIWKEIEDVFEEEKRLKALPKENLAVKVGKMSAHQADRRRVKHPKGPKMT